MSMAWAIALIIVTAALIHAEGIVEKGRVTFFDLPNLQGNVHTLTKEEWSQLDALEFAREFATGWGKPVILRGMARQHPAFHKWSTDEKLVSSYGRESLEVEFAKKETRDHSEKRILLQEFVRNYTSTEIYSVSAIPEPMLHDIRMFDLFRCSHASSFLFLILLWWSSGGTESVRPKSSASGSHCFQP